MYQTPRRTQPFFCRNRCRERVRVHLQTIVDRYSSQRLPSDSKQSGRLVERVVRLRGGVEHGLRPDGSHALFDRLRKVRGQGQRQAAEVGLVAAGGEGAVEAERAVSRAMGGSCSMPLAAHSVMQGEYLHLRAAWGDPEGDATLVRAELTDDCADLSAAERIGHEVAARLRAGGAR